MTELASLKMFNGYISATGHPIHSVFGSKVGSLGSVDRVALLPVRPNSRWRQDAILNTVCIYACVEALRSRVAFVTTGSRMPAWWWYRVSVFVGRLQSVRLAKDRLMFSFFLPITTPLANVSVSAQLRMHFLFRGRQSDITTMVVLRDVRPWPWPWPWSLWPC